MIHKRLIGNELYIYMNGELLIKRWLDAQQTAVFCNAWGGWVMRFGELKQH